jgi:flagellar export protein FliJ
MARHPDAGLLVALEQRRRALEDAQHTLFMHERRVNEELAVLATGEQRVQTVLQQIDQAQRPEPGQPLSVETLGDLERLLLRCEEQVRLQAERVALVRAEADEARKVVATAHQQVRALELVLEHRAAERAEQTRRAEQRETDETAARIHSRGLVRVRR